jgi:hypothetical protein
MPLPSLWTRPSNVREVIDVMAKGVRLKDAKLYFGEWGPAALMELLDEIDPRILTEALVGELAVDWIRARSRLRAVVEHWNRIGAGPALQGSVVQTLYDLLGRCRDEPIPPALPKLAFIADPAIRDSVARDLLTIDRLMTQNEWKAATVIGGSVIEALLLQHIEATLLKQGTDAAAWAAKQKWTGDRLNPDKWGLAECIDGAEKLGLLAKREIDLVKSCQGYRNLIHPGRERTTFPYDEGTAYAVVGGAKRLLELFG